MKKQHCRPAVFARIRPSTAAVAGLAVYGNDIAVAGSAAGNHADGPKQAAYRYTGCLDASASQEDVYECARPTIQSCLGGYNAAVLCYGQTGSGKTHSLLGSPADLGIVPRAVATLSDELSKDSSLSITISMVEIYCERIRDLLRPGPEDLPVQRHPQHGFAHAAGASEFGVTSEAEMMAFVTTGIANRIVQGIAMNSESSRSHLVISLCLQRAGPGGSTTQSRLCLVDLAGSERYNKTQAVGACYTEGCAINKSLSALGNVVSALSEGKKSAHVPYRDSKLTRLLQDCLAGNALMALIICLNPDAAQLTESISTLRFGSRALSMSSTVQVNTVASPDGHAKEQAAKIAELEEALRQVSQRLDQTEQQGPEPHTSAPVDDAAGGSFSEQWAENFIWAAVLCQSAVLTVWVGMRLVS